MLRVWLCCESVLVPFTGRVPDVFFCGQKNTWRYNIGNFHLKPSRRWVGKNKGFSSARKVIGRKRERICPTRSPSHEQGALPSPWPPQTMSVIHFSVVEEYGVVSLNSLHTSSNEAGQILDRKFSLFQIKRTFRKSEKPFNFKVVGDRGFEPRTSTVWGWHSPTELIARWCSKFIKAWKLAQDTLLIWSCK